MQNEIETPLTGAQVAMERVIRARAELELAKAEAGGYFVAVAVYTARELAAHGVFNLRQYYAWQEHNQRLEDAKELRKAGYRS